MPSATCPRWPRRWSSDGARGAAGALADLADVPATAAGAVRSGPVARAGLRLGSGSGAGVAGDAARYPPAGDHHGLRRPRAHRPGAAIVLDVRGRGLSDAGPSYALETMPPTCSPCSRGWSWIGRCCSATDGRPYRAARRPAGLTCGHGAGGPAEEGGSAVPDYAGRVPRPARRGGRAPTPTRWARSCPAGPPRAGTAGPLAVQLRHRRGGRHARRVRERGFLRRLAKVPARRCYCTARTARLSPPRGWPSTRGQPAARFVSIPDAGHMVFWDNPATALMLVAKPSHPHLTCSRPASPGHFAG